MYTIVILFQFEDCVCIPTTLLIFVCTFIKTNSRRAIALTPVSVFLFILVVVVAVQEWFYNLLGILL